MDEETKSYLNSTSVQDEDAILSSPKGSTSSKSPEHQTETNSGAALAGAAAQQKKVVLKRKLITSVSLTESEPSKSITSPTSTDSKVMKLSDSTTASAGEKASESSDSNGNADGNVVKLTQLSMKERLELRAKKFGAPVSSDVAKLARAERFGLPETKASISASTGGGGSSGAVTTAKTAADVELLKKRAERFGGSVSNTMVKIEMNEKLLKRQERFGAGAAAGGGGGGATTTTTTTTVSGKVEAKPISTQAASDYAEKAKLRLERFKTAA